MRAVTHGATLGGSTWSASNDKTSNGRATTPVGCRSINTAKRRMNSLLPAAAARGGTARSRDRPRHIAIQSCAAESGFPMRADSSSQQEADCARAICIPATRQSNDGAFAVCCTADGALTPRCRSEGSTSSRQISGTAVSSASGWWGVSAPMAADGEVRQSCQLLYSFMSRCAGGTVLLLSLQCG